MRTLFTVFIMLTFFWGCATVEQTSEQETKEDASTETASSVPAWFNPLVTSTVDSVSVRGFALASATDSSEAVSLAENTALNNLRYEIDVLAENTRVMLVEDENLTAYSEALSIIKLRNLVRDLPLSDADMEFKTIQADNDIYHVYAKASLSKNSLWNLISGRLNDSNFVDAMKTNSAK